MVWGRSGRREAGRWRRGDGGQGWTVARSGEGRPRGGAARGGGGGRWWPAVPSSARRRCAGGLPGWAQAPRQARGHGTRRGGDGGAGAVAQVEEGWGPALGVELCSAPWRAVCGRRREKEGRGGGRKKKKREKEKGKKKKKEKGERERESCRCDSRRRSATRALRRSAGRRRARGTRKKRDGIGIGTGVGTADRRDMISGDWELGRKKILE